MRFLTKDQSNVQPFFSRFSPPLSQVRSSGFDAVLEAVRILITLTGTGLAVIAILAFQQFLMQIYTARWQMALLFALIGLITALLLGQYHLRLVKPAQVVQWSALSSLTVSLLGIGVIVCILNTAPPV